MDPLSEYQLFTVSESIFTCISLSPSACFFFVVFLAENQLQCTMNFIFVFALRNGQDSVIRSELKLVGAR